MTQEEYRAYLLKEVRDYCGEYAINKIQNSIEKPNINLYRKINYSNNHQEYYFLVEDYYGRHFVRIHIYNNHIHGSSCNCYDYYDSDDDTCDHINNCIYYFAKELLPKPLTDYEKSINILNKYKDNNENKEYNVKEKLILELELNLENEPSFRLHIGPKKTYVINNENKFHNFIKSYINKEKYEFGKSFIYDPDKYYFNSDDEKLLNYLASGTFYQPDLKLSKRELLFLLDFIKDKEFELTSYGVIKNIAYSLPNIFYIDKQNNNYILKLNSDNYYIPNYSYEYFVYNHTLYILNNEEISIIKSLQENELDEITFHQEDLDLFKSGLLKRIKNKITISDNITDIVISSKPIPKLYFDFDKEKIKCNLKFDYNGNIIDYFDKNNNIIRDEEEENKILDILINEYNFNIDNNNLILSNIDDIGYLIEYGFSNLSKDYEIFTSKKIDNTLINKQNKVSSLFSVGMNGIINYSFNTEGIDIQELDKVFKSINNKKKYYKLKNGNLINLEDNNELNELNNLFNDLGINSNEIDKDGNIIIPKYRAFYIDSLKNNRYDIIKTDNSFIEFINKFREYKNVKIEFDEFDEKTLRPYQKEGVRWLYTLYKCDLGGILADEMGLGKSIQTISFIKQILKEKSDSKILIVSPTALVYNWKKEFDKFAPELKYIPVADNKIKRKEIMNNFDNYNIFITSYGLIRNDNDEYEDKEFELCVIDEAQAIKNYQAGLTKEIKKIKARTKIALTGTPIENSIYELWSIFDFIMPGYLNSINSFRESYNIHDVDASSLEKLSSLNYQINPFILRRKKQEVTKELPDKIENNIYLELPDMQKKIYMKELKETKKEIDELIASSGWPKARFKLLTLLTKLRQICIDPNIIYENYNSDAIKIDKLLEIVHDYIKDNHKILIFSTFKTVIDSVKKHFDNENISSYVIDGTVLGKKRTELVDKFNNDDTNCFLITLKSGGTGLNLTSADIVIHLDIWWNPQAENQATDRAHRIGQTKNVTVIKLITKGTIEERIIELQNKKRILSDNLIEGKNNSELVSTLTEKEMEELLSFGQDEV